MVYQGKRRFAGILPRSVSIAALTQARRNLHSHALSREHMSFHIVFVKSRQRRVGAPCPAPFSPRGDTSSTAKDSGSEKFHEDLGLQRTFQEHMNILSSRTVQPHLQSPSCQILEYLVTFT